MALVVTVTDTDYSGHHKIKSGTIAWDSSYPTGGEAITAADVGLSQIQNGTFVISANAGLVFEYVPTQTGAVSTGGTIKAYWTGSTTSGAFAEVTNTGNMSAFTATPFQVKGH